MQGWTTEWRDVPIASRCRWVLAAAGIGLAAYLAAAPNPWNTDDRIKIWAWGGTALALAGVGLLAATAGWWTRSDEKSAEVPALGSTPRWFWPLVAVAVACVAVQSGQRLDHDLWADEEVTLRLFVQGSYKPDPESGDGTVKFKEFGAGRAFHNYKKPTNHVLHSVLAKASVSVWRIFRDPNGQPFSERAFRTPAFFFGLLAVVTLAFLLKELGFPRAGVIAAFLLAVHPWFLRYASEARGYSMVLCFLPLLLVSWMRAMKTNRWRWWAAVGALQFALIYTFPAAIYPVAVLAAITAVLLLAGWPAAHNRSVAFARWSVSSFCGALLFVVLFAPCLPQLLDYLGGQTQARGEMSRWWLQDFGAYLLAGESWFKWRGADPLHPQLHHFATVRPAIFYAMIWSAILLAIGGAVRLARRGLPAAAVLVALVLPAPLAYEIALVRGWYLYEFYLIYALCGAVALVALGLDAAGGLVKGDRRGATFTAGLTLLFLTGYLQMTAHVRHWILSSPLEPHRASVLLTRPTTLPNYPGHADVITASFSEPPYLYDPHIEILKTPSELRAVMARAETEKKPLYLNLGGLSAAMQLKPEMYRIATASPEFEKVAELNGFEPYGNRLIARYVPAVQRNGSRED